MSRPRASTARCRPSGETALAGPFTGGRAWPCRSAVARPKPVGRLCGVLAPPSGRALTDAGERWNPRCRVRGEPDGARGDGGAQDLDPPARHSVAARGGECAHPASAYQSRVVALRGSSPSGGASPTSARKGRAGPVHRTGRPADGGRDPGVRGRGRVAHRDASRRAPGARPGPLAARAMFGRGTVVIAARGRPAAPWARREWCLILSRRSAGPPLSMAM